MNKTRLGVKFNESLVAVVPIVSIVLLLSLTFAPIPSGTLLGFLLSSVLLIFGMTLFSLGAELAMEPIGGKLGAKITKTKKTWFILLLAFLLGFSITIAEPDLQVLAEQVQSIPSIYLIGAVGIGVGLFLTLALLRMFLKIPLNIFFWFFYIVVFVLAFIAPKEFLAVAFDSGGVTTGPMTVPFIMAFGVGISAIRNDKNAVDDSFGLIALCSIGPILAVFILGLVFPTDSISYSSTLIPNVVDSVEMGILMIGAIPSYLKEMLLSLLPVVVFFVLFQIFSLKLEKRPLLRIISGLLYTYIGLVLFLTGVNVGFMPAGSYLGQTLASQDASWIIVPIAMLIGYFIVKAEPAVYVLMRQVEEITSGSISGKSLQTCLSIGVSVSLGLALVRVLTGISILWFLLPGYAIALSLSFVVPRIFTAIAFDSGGVASGPMTATFLLPFAMGASLAVGGDVTTDAFGVVAMVAMTPLITIQVLGLSYMLKTRRPTESVSSKDIYAKLPDDAIIEL